MTGYGMLASACTRCMPGASVHISAFSDGTCRYGVLGPFSRCCENQLKACGLSASISHAYWHLYVSTKALIHIV